MEFKSENHGEVTVVEVFLTRATLNKAVNFKDFINDLIDNGANKLVIDLGICEYIDSTFLGALVSTLKKVNKKGGDLRLVYNQEIPSLVFVLTRMDKVFKIFENLDKAIESFGGESGKKSLSWK
jgi:anti-anti-sigma factor